MYQKFSAIVWLPKKKDGHNMSDYFGKEVWRRYHHRWRQGHIPHDEVHRHGKRPERLFRSGHDSRQGSGDAFCKSRICAVHGKVMSEAESEYLEAHHIPHSYDKLTEQIINRTGDNICPMEAAVANIPDPEEGYKALCVKIKEMMKK